MEAGAPSKSLAEPRVRVLDYKESNRLIVHVWHVPLALDMHHIRCFLPGFVVGPFPRLGVCSSAGHSC